ncbi:MAG: hypothetical protein ABFR97_00940 [Thermodesulfobacteriota bacterium]
MPHTTVDELEDYTHQATSKLYDLAIKSIRKAIATGKTFNEALGSLSGIDDMLKNVIIDDFLKNLIVEQHFNKGRGIDDLALILDVPYERVELCRNMIIAEIDMHNQPTDMHEEVSLMTH